MHVVDPVPAFAVAFRFGRLERGRELGAGSLLALQQADTGGDDIGDITVTAGGNRLGREARQLGGQGHVLHDLIIGGGWPFGKDRAHG